jgi:predicted PhzF superfamily epimerase YddE/YHI9
MFAPWIGIPEDPVTGAAHTVLGPYWSERIGKRDFRAYQTSPRGGELRVRCKGDRVELMGRAVVTIRGRLAFDAGR